MKYHQIARTARRTFRRNHVRLVPVNRAKDLIELVDSCSPQSRLLRFHTGMPALRPSMAEQLAATPSLGLRNWRGRLVADARYTRTHDDEAELAVLISDKYQGRGLGLALLAVLFERAHADGVRVLNAEVLNSNDAMVRLLEKLAPVETIGFEDGARRLRIPLEPVALAA